mmetsp:Transcript_90285/g.291972  ORF Transcript_90285/g.291972 Transcript_90285/m.291972 type:complete len:96 (+) Transcript_90285:202-489(+)
MGCATSDDGIATRWGDPTARRGGDSVDGAEPSGDAAMEDIGEPGCSEGGPMPGKGECGTELSRLSGNVGNKPFGCPPRMTDCQCSGHPDEFGLWG